MITDWNRIDALVDKLAPEMIAVRRHLHAHPEPSGAERQTAQFLAERLRADGLEVRSVADDRGLLVAPPRARMGSRLGLRADTGQKRLPCRIWDVSKVRTVHATVRRRFFL